MNEAPTTPPAGPLLFQRLRWRLLQNATRLLLRRSQVRLVTILLCSLLGWCTLFAFSYMGFHELRDRWKVPIDGLVGEFVLGLLFLPLAILLVFSTGIILYSSLFASEETSFLLVAPIASDRIFAYRYQGAVAFSSWAFLLLGSPVLLAYGLLVREGGAAWYFYAVLPLFFLGFVLLPGSLGSLCCLLLVNYLPRRRKQVAWLAVLLLLAGVGWWGYRSLGSRVQELLLSSEAVNQVFGEFSLLRNPVLPTHWIAQGLRAAAVGEAGDMLYYLALVWSNGLFLYVLTAWTASRLYRRGYNRIAGGGALRRRYGGGWLDRGLDRLLGFLDPQTRLLIVKDFRTFRRDPAQWAQVLIFLGLAVLYFTGIRRFYQTEAGQRFQNGISLLNLTATCFLLCAYTGRFIYPMLSLEGRKFWILGLLPFERERLLWGKFAFSATGALCTAEFLVVFGDVMLGISWPLVLLHAGTVAVVAFGLSGLSVGLGACMPNFRETDPSKIAVGFGGTMNLIAGLLLLLLVIGSMALPVHLLLALRPAGELTLTADWWLSVGIVGGIVFGGLAVFIPLQAGARAFRRMEF